MVSKQKQKNKNIQRHFWALSGTIFVPGWHLVAVAVMLWLGQFRLQSPMQHGHGNKSPGSCETMSMISKNLVRLPCISLGVWIIPSTRKNHSLIELVVSLNITNISPGALPLMKHWYGWGTLPILWGNDFPWSWENPKEFMVSSQVFPVHWHCLTGTWETCCSNGVARATEGSAVLVRPLQIQLPATARHCSSATHPEMALTSPVCCGVLWALVLFFWFGFRNIFIYIYLY